ncbi:DUF6093 family protein [Streptomyces sp. NPDC048272]|uniref:DUF6093 family protein n=1 Tax=Streptomyces sp. NPDC048272 TaxID=3154616 RepID=UPI0034396BF9
MSSLEAVLAAGRLAALELQSETIRISRPGEVIFDPDSGTDTPSAATVLYEGRARVKPSAQSRGEEAEVGEVNVTFREYVASLPWDTVVAERPLPGDLMDVIDSPDARMVGLRLWVTGVQFSASTTVWRIGAEDRS